MEDIAPSSARHGRRSGQRAFDLVQLHLEAGHPLPTEPGNVVHQGEDLGRWVRALRHGWDHLTAVQQWICASRSSGSSP
ncbi:hypothetical protein ACGF0C_26950 [Streptomyces albidoflavus]|uniref:hypothetical protein n=1 Tax=Streptomyces sp. PLM4 TaxID=2929798 RepID=UPI00205B191E|nr:hypothetical protein [Streptomyces sp. PLM4]BDH67756.1 hypothetical protein MTP06_12050 [Streptomyces sp. PLM4]